MHESILVVDGGLDEGRKLCEVLGHHHYSVTRLRTLDELARAIQTSAFAGVILDLDSLPLDNRFLRNLCKDRPELCVIGASARTFHPELAESMRTLISVCLNKPVDEDELIYWLKSICERGPESRASPPATGGAQPARGIPGQIPHDKEANEHGKRSRKCRHGTAHCGAQEKRSSPRE